MPALVVFQTPLEAAATYQVVGVRGSTAMSMTRPPTTAGPMLRNSRPAKGEAGIPPFFSSGLAALRGTPGLRGHPVFLAFLTLCAFLPGLALFRRRRKAAARQQEPAEHKRSNDPHH